MNKELIPNVMVLTVILLAISSVLYFRKNIGKKSQQYLLFYLFLNFSFETIVLIQSSKGVSTYGIYNLEMNLEVLFFLFLFWKTTFHEKIRNSIPLLMIIFAFFSVYNVSFIQKWTDFNSNTYTLGSFFLFFVCGSYLIHLIVKKETSNPLRNLYFWISLGVLFCYLGNFPFLSNVNQLFILDSAMATGLRTISLLVNLLLYILIIVGVICNRNT